MPRCLVLAVLATLYTPWQVYSQEDKKVAPGAPLKLHIISGSREYGSEPSLKEFSKHLESHFKVTCTASWGRDGVQELKDLDQLRSAELMVVFARRMKLGDDQMKIIRAHWEKGKPIVGLRTASHAFQKADNELFDRKIMGNHYQGHYGNEPVKVASVKPDHPVLKGVKPFTSSKLYKAGKLLEDTIVLQTGDNGKGKHPVTMVHSYNSGRVFYSSLGVPQDFKEDNFRRMLVNAIFWTTHRDPGRMKK